MHTLILFLFLSFESLVIKRKEISIKQLCSPENPNLFLYAGIIFVENPMRRSHNKFVY